MMKNTPGINRPKAALVKIPLKKLAVITLVASSQLLGFAFAGMNSSGMALVPKQELLSQIKEGSAHDAENLLKKHSFDSDLLGMALHKTIKCDGFTPEERLRLMRMLINEGADIEYRDPSGATPLIISAKSDLAEESVFLLEKGALREATDNSAKSALDHAIERFGSESPVAKALTPAPQFNVPIVDNITLMMKKGHVYITYDLSGTEKACISLEGSLDGGKSYGMRFDHVAGDIGSDVKAKRGNLIIWKVKADYPEGLNGSEIIMDVVADKTCR
ncbi:MAG: hypothetical protein C0609_04860 [Deltaproteobacteria bacterium]|nr:MAG: hypothetical protein C0609_04860 [Deltaproteobacteria bacterium]